MATTSLEGRVARLEGLVEEIREEMRSTNTRLNHIESRLWWMMLPIVGIQLTTWITIMLAIFFK